MSAPNCIQLSPNNHNQQFAEDQDPCISSLTSCSGSSVLAATKLCGEVALFQLENVLSSSSSDDNTNNHNITPFATFRAHKDSLNSSKFLSAKAAGGNNGALLVTCSDDSSVRIFDCKNIHDGNRGYPIGLYPAPSEVNCLCESTDGTLLYAGCEDGSVVTYTFGGFADARSLSSNASASNNNNNNNDDQTSQNQSYESLNPFPQAAPPAKVDRFMVGEGAVNDIIIINLPYGDILFTATEDGCVRAWRTSPGQRAPNEPKINLPSQDEMNQQMNEVAAENNTNNNNNNDDDSDDAAVRLREMISNQLGDESADRLITSFDMLKGGQINHIVDSTIGNEPVILVAASNYVFAVPFDIGSGQLAEEPSILFNGNEDFVRGIHPVGNNSSSSSSSFFTVADDGTVAMFNRNLQNQKEPVGAMRTFAAEQQGLNIMSSTMMKSGNGNDDVLVTGSLLGSVKIWRL